MRLALCCAIGGLLTGAGALVAQSNEALMANDHYTRSHDYDLIHQRIEVSNFDWDSTAFEGRVTTTLVALRPGLDSVVLDEGALLDNTAVTDRAGAVLRAARHGDTVVVFPRTPVGFHDTLTFTIAYHGKVNSGNGLTYITTDGLPHRPEQIWSQGEDHNNHDWFPTYDFPNDKMTWEMVATVPAGDLAVSNGRLASNVVNGRTRTMDWRQDTPSATYLVSLIVAPLAELHDSWHGVPVDYFVYHDDSTRAWPLFHVTTDMIDTYSQLTGVPYPWAKYSETTVADFFGGMENVSATTLVDWLPDANAYQDRPWYRYILIPHELAHQWFGDYVTTINWANMWLNEGFAEFMPGQYWGRKLGEHAEEDYYLDEYRQFSGIDARKPMPLASLGSNNIYPKGALVLEMLKHYLGPDRFWAGIHTYLDAHAFGNATSDDLRQAFLTATGENLDWFWDEWVYAAGLPQFTVTTSYDSTAHAVAVTVTQTQADTLKPDSTGLRFRVPDTFRMPVTIRVGTAGGDIVQHAMLDARQQTITVPGVGSAPTMVVFDDGDRILKTLTFDQPTPWLATQLTRDSDLWDRQWVIGQLTRRPADAGAARSLAQAATSADYYLTRQQAASALGAFAQAEAEAPLLAALKDTSSAVRGAAAATLGRVGGAGAAAALHHVFDTDASYEVRASAVGAIVRLDTAGAAAVISKALATPSYQDVISHAAMQAAAQINDTAAIGAVTGVLDEDAFPSQLLAVMAIRGSGRAYDSLTAHLDDARAGVRTWIVSAFRLAAGRDRSGVVSRLTAALPTITHADTKDAVSKLLDSLKQ